MTTQPELSRRIPLRRLDAARDDDDGLSIVVEADAAERAELAQRLMVAAVDAMCCRFTLSGAGRNGVVEAEGLLHARVTQVCVVTAEPFEAAVTERFSLRFVPEDTLSARPDSELDLEADDEVPYAGGVIDLGEAATEQLALALDPYPHRPGVERPAGVGIGDPPLHGGDAPDVGGDGLGSDGERISPFAALSRLRTGPAN